MRRRTKNILNERKFQTYTFLRSSIPSPHHHIRVPSSVTRLGDFCTLGNHSKLVATIILPKSPTLLGKFCKGVKIIHFSSEFIFGQLL